MAHDTSVLIMCRLLAMVDSCRIPFTASPVMELALLSLVLMLLSTYVQLRLLPLIYCY